MGDPFKDHPLTKNPAKNLEPIHLSHFGVQRCRNADPKGGDLCQSNDDRALVNLEAEVAAKA